MLPTNEHMNESMTIVDSSQESMDIMISLRYCSAWANWNTIIELRSTTSTQPPHRTQTFRPVSGIKDNITKQILAQNSLLRHNVLTHCKVMSSDLARAFAGHKTFLSSFVYCWLRKSQLMSDLPRATKPGKLSGNCQYWRSLLPAYL